MFTYESYDDGPHENARIAKGIDETDDVVHGHTLDSRRKGNQLGHNVGSTTAHHGKAGNSSKGTIDQHDNNKTNCHQQCAHAHHLPLTKPAHHFVATEPHQGH